MKAKNKQTRPSKLKKQLRRHLKLAVVPHSANQYRPHLVRRYGLFAVLAVVVALQFGYNYSTGGTVLGAKQQVAAQDLLADTNKQRKAHNLPPLQLDAQLSNAAFMKAKDMYAHQYWAHTSPDGTTPWHWFGTAGYNYAYAGENLAKNFTSADAATAAWMASTEHRENILDTHYTQVGFAVVDGTLNSQPTKLIVALYGEPAATLASAASSRSTATTDAPVAHSIGLWTRLEMAIVSLTPAAVAALLVILFTAAVALMAHFYRRKMPKALRQSWYRHHGAYKAAGLMSLVVVVISLYSGGQI